MTRINSGAGAQSAPANKASESKTTNSPGPSSAAPPTSAAATESPGKTSAPTGTKSDADSATKSSTDKKQAQPKVLSSASVQAGGGDVMVRPAHRRQVKATEPEDAPDVDDAPDDGPDMDADGPDAAGGFFGRVLQRGGLRGSSRSMAADGGGDGGDAGEGGGKLSAANESGGASSKSSRRGRSKGRSNRGEGKRGAGKSSGGGGRVRAAEGRDKTEDVESVSVLVGQDEGGGDPVEQALNAHKRISGDDEHKNAFTSNYKDSFDPNLESAQVERLGSIQGAVHMVRLADHWESQGLDRQSIIKKTAQKLLGFTRQDQIKRTISEMNIAPIKSVYPLEVMLRILSEKPDFWPKVHRGEVLQNREELLGNRQIIAGHEFRIKYPEDYKIKSFALLGGGEPGYEFTPLKNGVYRMIVDEPGTWTFALSAEKKGEAIIDSFSVEVHKPGQVADSKAQ